MTSMKKIAYVILLELVRPFGGDVIQRHIEHLRALDEAGQLMLCGPFTDHPGGMVVVRADSYAAADEVARSDPFVAEGYETYALRTLEVADKETGY